MPTGEQTQARAREAYGKLPLSFEANQGQTDSQVKFLARGGGYGLFLSPTETVFSMSGPSKDRRKGKLFGSGQATLGRDSTLSTSVVRMKLVGANPATQVEGVDELPGKSNYLIGNDPAKWRTNIPSYGKVKQTAVYPGVDMIYYGDQRQLEYDFVVAPGANPNVIHLSFEGVKRIRIDRHGDLLLRTAGGEIRQPKPVVYQEKGGTKQNISGRYLLRGRHEVGFEIGKYDASRPLVIDPVLVYSTYLGGTGDDFGHAIAVDDFGNAYIAGETSSIDFPTRNPFQSQHGGTTVGYTNAFITKINASGSALIYSTYLGGSLYDRAFAIAVDHLGNAYITGSTSSTDFPRRNPIQSALGSSSSGGEDAFIAKLNPSGSDLVFSTYLGRGQQDNGKGIAVDQQNNVYVTGVTGDWPTTIDAFQPNNEGGQPDAFITKLSATGTQILYSTYLGGRGSEDGLAIAVDSSQNAYITGFTESALDFPTRNALQPTFGGGMSDAFVARIPTVPAPFAFPLESFDAENGGLPASPYSNFSNWNVTGGSVNLESKPFVAIGGLVVNLGGYPPQGASIETKSPLALKPVTYRLRFDLAIQNNVGVTVRLGNIFSETFTLDSLGAGGQFASVVRDIQVPAQTSAKLSFEYIGGSPGGGVWLDNISVFERTGSEYVTFLGGSGDESRLLSQGGIKLDAAGSAYVTGWTDSPDFPKANAIQLTLGGGRDAFISKLNPSGSALVYSTFYGGAAEDLGNDHGIDAAGNVFIVGSTRSSNFPIKNAIQPTFGGGDNVYGDAFALKLSSTGGEVVYSTYLGGNRRDLAEGVAVGSNGDAFVTGYTTSTDFPLANPLQNQVVVWDAFVSKIPSVIGSGVTDVLDVFPKAGGNTGQITTRIIGENFGSAPVSVKLRGIGFPDLVGSHVSVDGPSTISSTFDLMGAAPGPRDVEVVFPGNLVRTLKGAFTVQSGGAAQVWVDILGRDAMRRNAPETYSIVYGNRGNVNIYDVLLFVRIPKGTLFSIRGLVPPAIVPPPELNLGAGVELNSEILIPIWFYVLPAGFVASIRLDIQPPTGAVEETIKTELFVPPPSEFSRTGDFSFPSHHLDLLALEVAKAMVNVVLGPGSRQNLATEKGNAKSVFPADNCGGIEDRDLLLFCTQARIKEAFRNGTLQSEKLVDLNVIGVGFFLNMLTYAAWAAFPEFSIPFAITISAITAAWDIYHLALVGEALKRVVEMVVNERSIRVVTSLDPNEKVGARGAGQSYYLSSEEPLRYVVFFENAETATAPAQEVTINDQLDPNLVDLSSFNFGPVSFGSSRITPSGANFTTDVDLRPDRNLIVRVNGEVNTVTGRITWKFISLDPATGLPPTDPLAGFLPPSVHPPEGDGNVFFTVSPRSTLPTGTVINNSASIIFDNNAAISTPTWSNTIDNSKPASHVLALPATQNSATFNVQWSGTDTGSGIGDYTIYVSDNGGAFTPWLTQTTATQGTFGSAANHTYSFFSVARDLTGNTETLKTTAEATTRILAVASIAGKVSDPYGNGVGDVRMTLSGDRSATAQTDESGASSFADLPTGSYTLTPSKTNYSFSPLSKTFGSLSTNQTADFIARVTSGAPILISEETSTRALALDSVLWLREPFQLGSPIPWGVDRRTRVMLFMMNFDFQPGEDYSIVRADAEDEAHRVYPLTVEYVGRTPGSFWLNSVVVRLNDDLGDLGDVLIRVSVRGASSNRVRLGIGHKGGGPPDDLGAVPTPGRRP